MSNCIKCNSDKIVPNAMVLDTGHYSEGYLQIVFDESPEAMIFKNRSKSSVRVSVCGNCGYIEFYAIQPGLIYQSYQNTHKNK